MLFCASFYLKRLAIWYISTLQIEESTTVVTSQTAEIGAAEMTLTELRRTVQSLEIDLDSMRNLVRTLSSFHWEQLFLPLHFPLLLPTSLVPGK